MKKTLALILAAVMTVLTVASCKSTDTEAPIGFKEISDDSVDYDLFIPDEWQADISTGVTAAYYSSNDPSNISMVAFELDGSVKTIEDYWNSYLPSLAAVFPDLSFENAPQTAETEAADETAAETDASANTDVALPTVGEPEQLMLDGVPALAYNYTGTMDGTLYKFYQILTFRNASVYIFTYTAKIDNYDAHIEDVVEILGNFKFH